MSFWRPWKDAIAGVWSRLKRPFSEPSYVAFYLVSVFVGAIGVWIAFGNVLAEKCEPLRTCVSDERVFQSIISFFVAYGCAACTHSIIVADSPKYLRAISLLGITVTVALAFACALAYRLGAAATPWLLGSGVAVALFQHWIAGFDYSQFAERKADSALGASTDSDLAGPSDGFTL